MSRPLLTVVVATHDRQAFLNEALRSVLTQSVSDFECIVVDDASSRPASVPDDPRLRLIRREENGGPAAAWNTAMADARGEYLVFMGDDDLLVEDRLEIALEGLDHAPVAICYARWIGKSGPQGRMLLGDVRATIMNATVPSLGVTAIRRDVAPRFDERFLASADVEWWLRLSHTCEVFTVPKLGYLVRKHATPRHRNGVGERIKSSHMLLDLHQEYFLRYPSALAFRWKRIGLMAEASGDVRLARAALVRSLRARPTASTAGHLARILLTGTSTPNEEGVPT